MLINAYATHADPPALAFTHTIRSERDWREADLVEHLEGLKGYITDRPQVDSVAGISREIDSRSTAALDHVDRVRHHISFEIEPDELPALSAWAIEANALLFFSDSTLRDPQIRVLFDPIGGEIDEDAEIPTFPHGEDRKRHITAELERRGIPVNQRLPIVGNDPEVVLRTPEEAVDRMSSLLAVAVRAESMADGHPLSAEQLASRLPRALNAMTPIERDFVRNDSPEEQQVVNHAWHYECIPVLLWVFGLMKTMGSPDTICDVPFVTSAVLGADLDDLVRVGFRRSVAEILDQVDGMYRLHWAVRDLELKGLPPLADIESGVVIERRTALEWLIKPGTEWDDITLDT